MLSSHNADLMYRSLRYKMQENKFKIQNRVQTNYNHAVKSISVLSLNNNTSITKQVYKPTHRAFRNKVPSAQASKLSAYITPAFMQLNRGSKFVRNHKLLMLCLSAVAGGTYYRSALQQDKSLQSVITNKANASAKWHFKDVFTRGPVNYVWAMWWVRVFKTDSMIDSLLWLLLTDIKKQCFLDDAADFGIEWINGCVVQPKVVSQSAKLCTKTFAYEPEVI